MITLNAQDLREIAEDARSKKEAGVTLLIATAVLAALFFIGPRPTSPSAAVVVDARQKVDSYSAVPIEAKAAIVYDLVTHEVLYKKNAEVQLPLASLTKILTVYSALAALPNDSPITVPRGITVDSPRGFVAGDTLQLTDMAKLTLTGSLNDGAVAILDATARARNDSQTSMLAGAAAGLGLAQTYALNGSGLDESRTVSGGYGSAKDLAILAGALLDKAPSVALATTEKVVEAVSAAGKKISVMNTDPIVNEIPRLLLSKTGFTDLAGGNLALVFDAALKHPIAVIILGSSIKGRFTDGAALVAATIAHFSNVASL